MGSQCNRTRASQAGDYNAGMTHTAPQVFAGLEPDTVLDALQALGVEGDGRLLALNSYENRVYQAGVDGGAPVVVKFYRPGRWDEAALREEHRFVAELAAAEIPVVPALVLNGDTLHRHAEYWFAVYPRQGGRSPDLDRLDTLEWTGRLMGRIHAIGSTAAFHARPALDPQTFGEQPRDWLLAQALIPAELRPAWEAASRQAIDAAKRCYERAGELSLIRLHGDCHAGNLLWTDDGPHFVDFDDCRTGPAIQDLWMLLSGERNERISQLSALLAGYEDFFAFEPRELHLIEALRTLRLLHYSAWLAMRREDPAFLQAFPWFGSVQYWQDRILELREQIALMDEPPLWSF